MAKNCRARRCLLKLSVFFSGSPFLRCHQSPSLSTRGGGRLRGGVGRRVARALASRTGPLIAMEQDGVPFVWQGLDGAGGFSLEENIQWLDMFLGAALSPDSACLEGGSRGSNDDGSPAPSSATYPPAAHSEEHSTQFLDAALEQLSRDTESLLKSSRCSVPAIDKIDGEIRDLLDMRDNVAEIICANDEYTKSIRETLRLSRDAMTEVVNLREMLVRADVLHKEDQRGDMIPLHARKVQLPLFPPIYSDIALLVRQGREIEQLRAVAGKFPWTPPELKRLRVVVVKECKRVMTLDLAAHSADRGILARVASMSEDELSLVSMPEHGGDDAVDWDLVADEVGGAHTANECRTRWLMIERPGINKALWSEDELRVLSEAVSRGLAHGPVKWAAIANTIGNGRLAVDCFSACQQHEMIPACAALSIRAWTSFPFTAKEIAAIESLDATWDNHHSILLERIANGRPKVSIMSRVARMRLGQDAQPEVWHSKADDSLLCWVVKKLHRKRLTVMENPQLADPLDFAEAFRGRPRGATAEQVKTRWLYLVGDYQQRPHHYIRRQEEGEWSPEDDDRLASVIEEIKKPRGRIPWLAVAKSVGMPMKACKRRYLMVVSKRPTCSDKKEVTNVNGHQDQDPAPPHVAQSAQDAGLGPRPRPRPEPSRRRKRLEPEEFENNTASEARHSTRQRRATGKSAEADP